MEIESKITGSALTANEFNQIPDEMENLINKSGQTASSSDLTQITKAVSQFVADGDFYSTSGTANAIVLSAVTPRVAPTVLTNGMRVRFLANYDNTQAVTVNVNNLGAKNITVGGQNISAGKLSQNRFYVLTYSSSTDTFELFESGSSDGGSGLEVCDIGMALYVDETKGLRRYLNGQIVDINTNTQAFLDRLQEITTLHPSLLCTEEEWQTAKTMSAFGQVGKFVFNYSGDKIVSVRLPRVVNVQGLFDLQNLGMTVSAGLPNIEGRHTAVTSSAAGAFIQSSSGDRMDRGASGGVGRWGEVYFDASLSSSIYGKSNTVQPEAIQYPYFIQIATGSETENNIINEIELNNPYSLFDSKYSDHELNNLSWLKSKGQWNNKADYPSAYDKLLKVYNGTETVNGLSVKLSTETYTDYDFVLNTAEETFRLPLKNHTADDSIEGLTLYFYVGETVQNANLIDAGRIGEQLANCITRNDCKAYVTETYQNGTSWYRVYSDGWCEQGGTRVATSTWETITFLKSFINTNYTALISNSAGGNTTNSIRNKTATSMQIYQNVQYDWQACGYIR